VTFGIVAARFIDDHVRQKRKASTADEYERKLDVDIPPSLKATPIADVDREPIAELHLDMHKRPVAANRVLAFISAVLSYAEQEGLRPLNTNEALRVEKYPEKARERFLTIKELREVGGALDKLEQEDPRTQSACDAIRLIALTGARRNEILQLRWDDFDQERELAWLQDSKTGPRPLRLGAAGTALVVSRERRSAWVFPSYRKTGAPLTDVRKTLARVIKKAEVKPFRLHDLRHSFASVAVAAGHSLPVTGAMLGHARASTTERYAHLQRDHVSEAVDDVQGRISAALQGPSRA
jgi:integrase